MAAAQLRHEQVPGLERRREAVAAPPRALADVDVADPRAVDLGVARAAGLPAWPPREGEAAARERHARAEGRRAGHGRGGGHDPGEGGARLTAKASTLGGLGELDGRLVVLRADRATVPKQSVTKAKVRDTVGIIATVRVITVRTRSTWKSA